MADAVPPPTFSSDGSEESLPPDVPFLPDEESLSRTTAVLTRLRDVLEAADFDRTAALPLPGGPLDLIGDPVHAWRSWRGRATSLEPSAVPGFYRALLRRRHPQAVAHWELLSGAPQPHAAAAALLGETLLAELIEVGALTVEQGRLRSEILLVWHRGRVIVADGFRHRGRPDFCYLGRLSFPAPDLLADSVGHGAPLGRVLDLGCGAGVAVATLGERATELVSADVVPRAVRFARLNAALNQVPRAGFVVSDVLESVSGSFDAILTHPPGVWSLTAGGGVAESGGGDFGLELPRRMIGGALQRLRPGGAVYAIVMAPVLAGRPYAPEAVREICAGQPAEVVLYPQLEYYEYAHRELYRAHRVGRLVRYLAVLRPADRPSLRYAHRDRSRLLASRLRSLPARGASRLLPARRDRPGSPAE